jgi:hypothetical protein
VIRASTDLLSSQDEPDFVRLAVKCKALIVPFAAVGADDAYDIMMVSGVYHSLQKQSVSPVKPGRARCK